MIDIEITKRGRARVWIDESPSVEPLSSEVFLRQEGLPTGKRQAFHKRVVIELFQPFGATFHYGLLGTELQVNAGSELLVAVPIDTPNPKIPYVDSLAAKVDDVVIGSTPEFAEAVLASLRRLPSELLPSGQLNFTFMAHGAVGSAQIIFEKLAAAVVQLLIRIEPPQGEGDMAEILKGA